MRELPLLILDDQRIQRSICSEIHAFNACRGRRRKLSDCGEGSCGKQNSCLSGFLSSLITGIGGVYGKSETWMDPSIRSWIWEKLLFTSNSRNSWSLPVGIWILGYVPLSVYRSVLYTNSNALHLPCWCSLVALWHKFHIFLTLSGYLSMNLSRFGFISVLGFFPL